METPAVFRKWRVILVSVLAIGLTAWMFFFNLSKTEFREVPNGTGTHVWRDINGNRKVDFTLSKEFEAQPQGNYVKKSALQVLQEVEWTRSTAFWLFLSLLAMFGRDVFYILRIRFLTDKELSWKAATRTIFLWEYASALAPGVVSGAAVAMFILQREKIQLGRSTAIVITTAFFDNLFFVLLIPVVFLIFSGGLLLPNTTLGQSATVVFWTGYAVFALLCLALFTSLFLRPHFVGQILERITRIKIFRRFRVGALETGKNISETAIAFRSRSIGFWITGMCFTAGSWISRYLVISFVFQAFVPLSLQEHMLLLSKQFILWMFLRIAPTPGGSGVAEWAFGELLGTFAASGILLGAMAVLWRLIGYFPYLLIGAILLPSWINKKR